VVLLAVGFWICWLCCLRVWCFGWWFGGSACCLCLPSVGCRVFGFFVVFVAFVSFCVISGLAGCYHREYRSEHLSSQFSESKRDVVGVAFCAGCFALGFVGRGSFVFFFLCCLLCFCVFGGLFWSLLGLIALVDLVGALVVVAAVDVDDVVVTLARETVRGRLSA